MGQKRSSDIRIFNKDKLTQYKTNSRNIYKEWMTTDYKKKILNYKPEGRRNIGWGDDFREEETGQGT